MERMMIKKESRIKNLVKKYGQLVIGLVVGYLICILVGAGTAQAGGLKVFEAGIRGESDFTDIKGTSTSEMEMYSFGELDFEYILLDYALSSGLEGGEYNKTLEGSVGVYGRLYTVKGGALEVLAGVEQPVFMDSSETSFSDVRVWKLRVRKPY
jgi:hypothetical protein